MTWEPNPLWEAYCEEYGVLEEAREEWEELTLRYLEDLAEKINQETPITIKRIDVDKWANKRNVQFERRSQGFDMDSDYSLNLKIGFDSFGENPHCQFYTRVLVRLGNRGSLRKKESRALEDFLNDMNEKGHQSAHLDPERTANDAYFFSLLDTMDEDFDLEAGFEAVENTLETLPSLIDRLEATREDS